MYWSSVTLNLRIDRVGLQIQCLKVKRNII